MKKATDSATGQPRGAAEAEPAISRREVEHIALLARLEASDAELDAYAGSLSRLLRYFERLNELNTDGVEPTSHPVPLINVLRRDVERPSLPVGRALANAPEEEDNCFKAPRVIQES
ncbi:MAG: Aspartyl/glutamyl-tRNA(Asn/Gln) amidotransferase subunit C [candidate division BRC1 bacterium ADurb.BinA364]|nr:MAG: Aspartyl/glutamyl-tRNA(Asn/Gln) amidotransferase subunit C [candidate division BRC1 bacterium ADurb.BinA364]